MNHFFSYMPCDSLTLLNHFHVTFSHKAISHEAKQYSFIFHTEQVLFTYDDSLHHLHSNLLVDVNLSCFSPQNITY